MSAIQYTTTIIAGYRPKQESEKVSLFTQPTNGVAHNMSSQGQKPMTRSSSRNSTTDFLALNIDRKSKDEPLIIHTYQGPETPSNGDNAVVPPKPQTPKSIRTIDHPQDSNSGSVSFNLESAVATMQPPNTPGKRPFTSSDGIDEENGDEMYLRSLKKLRETTEAVEESVENLIELQGKLVEEYKKKIKELAALKREEGKVNAKIAQLAEDADPPSEWLEKLDDSCLGVDAVMASGLRTIANINQRVQ